MVRFFQTALIISPFLLLVSYIMIAKSKGFWRIFTVHTIVVLIYLTFVMNYSKLITGHDEYGLGKFGLGLFFIVGHITIGFVHGLFIFINKRKRPDAMTQTSRNTHSKRYKKSRD